MKFVHNMEYRFKKDYLYSDYQGSQLFKAGEVVLFDYPGIGDLARFYTKEIGVWRLLLIPRKEAFKVLEEV